MILHLDDSVTLSVGQKQIADHCACSLYDAPLLILDEATSSVDTRTEELIQKVSRDVLMEGALALSLLTACQLSAMRI